MKKKTNIEKANIINLLISGQTNSFGTQIFDYANQLVISGLSNNTNLYMGLYQGGGSNSWSAIQFSGWRFCR
ncbi:hypothetical protein F5ESL0260_01970 [Lactobacillus sp. ESL0260]|uniref:hypothetical protein n=1 Tax=Lactobacillus TaxID=1578 RepID=UPI000EFDB2D1|nr:MULTISPECIES: hypothetical protein [Lactobacillus]RMC59309.1 hypothetical protein F5ESL0260_01970 [Lactobacillus sp. ESL0260]